MCEKKAVVIGAGQTGRGFIAPILKENGYQLTFVDKNEKLIQQLKNKKKYTIYYFGNEKETEVISNFDCLHLKDPFVIEKLIEADVIFVSIFADNIKDLVGIFEEVSNLKKSKIQIICCENGVDVKRPLINSQINAVVSEGIIFCTTLSTPKTLDLKSQYYPELPIDGSVKGLNIEIQRMPLEKDFKSLIQRKIYTYNFISAVVAYLGSYLNYKSYGEAANDSHISDLIDRLVPILSSIIAQEYGVAHSEQLLFTNLAVKKFKNTEIADTIYRNARQVSRKLTPDERLLTPLRLALKYHKDETAFELVIASALYYGHKYEKINIEKFYALVTKEFSEKISETIKYFFEQFLAEVKIEVLLTEMN